MSKHVGEEIHGGKFLIGDVDEEILTPEDVTAEHRLIAKTTEDFVHQEIRPKHDQLEQHDFQQAVSLFRQAGTLGLMGTGVPDAYGGLGLDLLSSALVTEKMSTASGFAVSHNIHVGVGLPPIVYYGSKQQKQTYLPDLALGQRIAAYALTEPGSGSDALAAKTTAQLDQSGSSYRLNGEKQWITNASIADVFIVFAKVDRKHLTAFIVERDFPGVSTGAEEKKMGIHSCSTATLLLDNAEVPVENVLGEVGRGHEVALNTMNLARHKLALSNIGQAKRALQLAVSYANEREQFRKAISSFPLIQEKLADMAIAIYAAESSVYRTVGLLEQALHPIDKDGGRVQVNKALSQHLLECALNKFFASEVLDFVVDEAVQIHGGYGYMAEYEIERMYRDARINRIFEGTNEINRLAAARALVKQASNGQLSPQEAVRFCQAQLDDTAEAFTQEKQMLRRAKYMFWYVFDIAFSQYGPQLHQEQEILVNFADIVNEIYAMDSVIRRTEQAAKREQEAKNKQKRRMTAVFCQEGFQRIISHVLESIAKLEKGESFVRSFSSLCEWACIMPFNAIDEKRMIAGQVIAEEQYVV